VAQGLAHLAQDVPSDRRGRSTGLRKVGMREWVPAAEIRIDRAMMIDAVTA
jgi:hypothetical protein